MSLIYYLVDVFAEAKLEGNQLAVFLDNGLKTEQMQAIALEMNLSETTFITQIDNDNLPYKVRIFTKETELPFAGHPTLGTAYIIQKEILRKKVSEVTLDLKAGLIPVKFNYDGDSNGILWMKQLDPIFGDTHQPEVFADILGLQIKDIDADYPIQEVSTGVFFYIVPLKTRKALENVKIDFEKLEDYSKDKKSSIPLMFCPETLDSKNQLKVRMITSSGEDPATGSANGCLAGYLVYHRYFDSNKIDIKVEQGLEINRPSILYLKSEDLGGSIDVRVGGKVELVAKGEFI
jgi:trans-2,3-dihydro-3-hydroxyanthranilate isomerase